MDKNHNCIEKIREEWKKADPSFLWARFDLSTIQDMASNKGIMMTGQRIEVGFLHKKHDGTQVQKTKKTFVTHTFCPFCGKKYK